MTADLTMQFNPDNRHILVITDKHDESLRYAEQITSELDSVETVNQNKALSFLGQELDAVIFDMHESFDPNAFGAITGTIRGGGFLILLRPIETPTNSLFLSRFNQVLENSPQVHFLTVGSDDELLLPDPPRKTFAQVFATPDQENAVASIIKVVTGHRKRPLVISSDRGRGKSAALGIAAAALAKQGIANIIICAPSKKAATIVFKHANLHWDETQNNLTYYSPDELQQQKPKADLVLIDEAAAIPITLLSHFLKHYSRIVFASTQHGYEGCGRGFAINFRKVLNSETPQWKNCELKTPIRWNKNDSLEQFTFDTLLLNANAAENSQLENVTVDDCRFIAINKEELLSNTIKLNQLFGLLVSAHYQTKPSDLMQLLDDDSVKIFCLEAKDTVVAVALVITEGNLITETSDPELSADIFAGKRRLKGHLVAQALSSNIGIESAIKLSGERISRIAVHSELQNQGLGSYLLQQLIDRSTSDYLSSCYGATESLIDFWQSAGFKSVHLGIKRDASSGSHSVTMLFAKTAEGFELIELAQSIFARNFIQLLSDSFRDLESEIIFALLSHLSQSQQLGSSLVAISNLSENNQKQLNAFANENRGYENNLHLIWDLVISKLTDKSSAQKLNPDEKKILILKVLQKQTWNKVKQEMGKEVSGKKDALALIRKVISKLL